MPRGSSHREQVEQIARAATQPFPIVSIAKSLDEFKSIRGRTFSRDAGCEIDLIVGNYPSMRWWMGKGGLVIEVVPDGANRLSASIGGLESWFAIADGMGGFPKMQ